MLYFISMEANNTPKCVGIIMDGNRRWARATGKIALQGHQYGYKKLKEFLGWAKEAGVETVIAYAFSTENWRRPREEIDCLMRIFRSVLKHEINELKDSGVRLKFIGSLSRFSEDIKAGMKAAEKKTEACDKFTLAVAVSYGGRAEIVSAVKKIMADNIPAEKVDEENFSNYLWTHGIPDPDLIVRTGGEIRLSNFLPWQSIYSELFFTETLWPAFEESEFKAIIEEFGKRKRNLGR